MKNLVKVYSEILPPNPLKGELSLLSTSNVKQWLRPPFRGLWGNLLTIILLFPLFLTAQNYSSGLLMDDEIYQTLPRQTESDGSKNNLPPRTDLQPYCPSVRNQGDIFSCVGWSVGYGALTIERAVRVNCTDKKIIDHNAHSALFVYNQINEGNCNKGSRISDAIQFLMEKGNCFAREFDFDVNDCEKQPDDSLALNAEKFSIEDFQTLFHIEANEKFKIWKTRQALAHRKPVVIGMNVRKNFYQLKNARFWWPDKGNTTPAGGHAMVVVGYDDFKGAFRLFNSWGTSWGDKGYIWVKYADFGKFCKYAYILHLSKEQIQVQNNQGIWVENQIAQTRDRKIEFEGNNELAQNNYQDQPTNQLIQQTTNQSIRQPQKPKQTISTPTPTPPPTPKIIERPLRTLAGEFSFEEFTGFYGDQPQFREAEVNLNYQFYELKRQNWKIGTRFQMKIQNAESEQYIYVFSIDAAQKAEIHFPKNGNLNNKYKGIHESALIISPESEMLIPGKDPKGQHRVLKLAQAGTDRLCVLFSTRKIPNRFLKGLTKRMVENEGDFMKHLAFLLGDKMIPLSDINYKNGGIGFEAKTRSRGVIVPLILEVKTQ